MKGDWKEDDLPGAGQVYNLGSHLIDQAVALFGRPDSVTGFVSNVRGLGNPNVDDTVSRKNFYSRMQMHTSNFFVLVHSSR